MNGAWICAFQKAGDARRLHGRTLTYKYGAEPLQAPESRLPPDTIAPFIKVQIGKGQDLKDQSTPPTPGSDTMKTFKMFFSDAGREYSHKRIIRRNVLHGNWRVMEPKDRDFVYNALQEVIPSNIAKDGLCDWVTGGQLSVEDNLARLDKEVATDFQIADRFLRRRNHEAVKSNKLDLLNYTSLHDIPTSAQEAQADAFAHKFSNAFSIQGKTVSSADNSDETSNDLSADESALKAVSDTISEPDDEPPESQDKDLSQEQQVSQSDIQAMSEPLRTDDETLASQDKDLSQEKEASRSDFPAIPDGVHDSTETKARVSSQSILNKILGLLTSSQSTRPLESKPHSPRTERDRNDQEGSAEPSPDDKKDA